MLRRCSARLYGTVTNVKKWDLYSGVCVERHPVITTSMSEMEIKYQELLKRIEFENSLKADHEIRLEEDKAKEKALKLKEFVDTEEAVNQTARDFEDACNEELKKFIPAPRVTEADKKNILTSLERKLDKTLVLLTKQAIGDTSVWIPPHGMRIEGESMRQAAERVLKDACGTELNVKFYGNAPIGFYKFAYPKSKRSNGSHGAKIFYFLAKYENGSVTKSKDYQWLDRKELAETLPPSLHKTVSDFLIFD